MKVETNQRSKDDKRLARVVLLAEIDMDSQILDDVVSYIKIYHAPLTQEIEASDK